MTGLINLITQYSEKLNILPIIVGFNMLITIAIHFLTKKKFIKYIPSLLLGISAIGVLIVAFPIFTSERGLDLTWIATFLGSAGLVGLFLAIILDLTTSIIRSNDKLVSEDGKVSSKKHPVKKASKKTTKKVSEAPNKNRVAKKHKASKKRVDSKSKYNTTKIKPINDDSTIKTSKVREKANSKTITFESDDSIEE